ncbi:DUF4367 domain-containing protein [Candidatus Saccharibacteria bacterium]|nr:DUF4367 domain-containing protein [Candidatus Saccharibacteria bacterium]
MGTVVINGQKYDSVTGLRINGSDDVSELIETGTQESPVTETTPKIRRQSKQQRLAEAIAREFDDDELGAEIAQEIVAETTSTHELPEWITQFTEKQVGELIKITDQPAWITNYVSGGKPVEIQPIGLEAAARDTAAEQQIEVDTERTEPIRQTAQDNHYRVQQHSSTLNRNFVKKPAYTVQVSTTRQTSKTVSTHPDVHHFATVETEIRGTEVTNEVKADAPFAPVLTHSVEEKLAQREVSDTISTTYNLKDALINEQMDQPIDHKARNRAEKKALRIRRRFTAPTLITAALAILVLGGYFTYVNMPSISVRVAAAHAGIDARVPYIPSGYSIDGPVAYTSGSVTINYRSNGGGAGYSLTQQNNTWGNNVVLDSLVENNEYAILEAGQVIIYRYGSTAAWVDRGILFTLSGNESLGDNQITRIAESV